ncbi:PepSY-associated TM region [Caballeronia sp. SBC1]|uniref:PepSY-associated TM helix domain-containing protein n=1 Tax=unclassified Caballeronia TaxID=2646786 RepID=UPI0013E11BA2|nr:MULTISPECIES: PepSY-associated TM helix domain-containing protein [unclassified Caballeronia]QIE23963.1 PepSY-associated TM region [Caballeronia sp. SBC2]QIN61859.1 PepSY-associated TM region [Caballeronia sp. SBC1]
MRSDVIRVYKTVHTWTGIVAGLALFIAFYAGAITMFKDTLDDWVTPPSPAFEHAQTFPLEQASAVIEQTLAAYPAARRQFTLRLEPPGAASLSWRPRGQSQRVTATLNADGKLETHTRETSNAARFIDILHMTAGIPGGFSVGMGVMGVVSLLYGLALVSGVIVLLPSLVKDLFALRVGKNLKRMWLDAHNVIGILSLPFHILMALSVVAFGLNDTIFAVQDHVIYSGTLDATKQAQNPYFAKAPAEPGGAVTLLPPLKILAAVKQRAPGFEARELSYRGAGAPGATVFVRGDDPRYLARSGGFALLDPVSGQFLNAQFLPGAPDANAWSAATSAFFALHFGSYGGAPVQWGYFFLGLAGAFLFYSGNLLWIESRRKLERRAQAVAEDDRVPPKQRRAAYFMAALTVGVTLGCIAGISATLAAGKWLNGRVADMSAWHAWIYYTVFLVSIAWAFLRGAARGSVELLALATGTTLLVPLASIAGWLAPSTGLWFEPSAVGVDVCAAVGAACFAWMWRATARRAAAGRQDSVWAAGLAVDK